MSHQPKELRSYGMPLCPQGLDCSLGAPSVFPLTHIHGDWRLPPRSGLRLALPSSAESHIPSRPQL